MAPWREFEDLAAGWPGGRLAAAAASFTAADVGAALAARRRTPEHFLSLLSPAAAGRLEELAQAAHRLTLERFGRVVQLFAPIYLSNECVNRCRYCGFHAGAGPLRATLSEAALAAESAVLAGHGFRHVLLVAGDHRRALPLARLIRSIEICRRQFASVSIEVYPLDEAGYRRAAATGCDGLTLYQETYDPGLYAWAHPRGRKADYGGRLAAVEAAGRAGLRRINLGALLGLGPWLPEAYALGLHARHLARRYWRTQLAVSFPRLCPTATGFQPSHPVSDAELVQMICALRLFLPDSPLVISTREPAGLRDSLIPLGITQMSAGSRTEPGGYTHPDKAGEQFAVADRRSPEEVAAAIRRAGFEPVWKDWDRELLAAGDGAGEDRPEDGRCA